MEEHSEAIMNLVRQLTIHKFEYDENKGRLQDLLAKQAAAAAPPAAAPPPPPPPAHGGPKWRLPQR